VKSKESKIFYSLLREIELLEYFRKSLAQRGACGIIGIGRTFRIMDVNGDGTLTMSEFSQACKDFRINMTVDDAKFLFNQFDQNKDGRLNYDEFLRGVRGEMSDSRREIVRKAFSILDTNQNGQIEIADIAGTYSAEKHPAVVEGRKTED